MRVRLPRPVWVTLAAALFVGGNELRHVIDGREKLANAALPSARPSYDVDVELNVAPEQFHMTRLQLWGTMTGAHDRTVRLRNVSADRLAELARQPWVASIHPAQG